MNAIPKLDTVGIIRLTRAGRLEEATALIQAGLNGRQPSPAVEPQTGALLDLEAPASPEGSWHDAQDTRGVKRPSAQFNRPARRSWSDAKRFDLPGLRSRPSAPRPIPAGASFTTHHASTKTGALAYKLYIPSTSSAAPMPLIVMLHGCTQNPDDFAAGTRMNELAEAHGFLVVYPEQTQVANASRCWNWFRTGDQVRDGGEPALIAAATRQVIATHQIDPKRVFVAGLSAGGAAAAIMGCAYPDLFAGVGVHSGLACGAASDLPSALAAMRGAGPANRRNGRTKSNVPTIVFHGTADHTVAASNAAVVADQASGQGATRTTEEGITADGTGFTRLILRDDAGLTIGETWMIEGAGHAWSGGSSEGSYTDPRGPDASVEMLRFFGLVPPADR
jgi:poly(hydroxyalkanoate) depolymerase family esterase